MKPTQPGKFSLSLSPTLSPLSADFFPLPFLPPPADPGHDPATPKLGFFPLSRLWRYFTTIWPEKLGSKPNSPRLQFEVFADFRRFRSPPVPISPSKGNVASYG
ncbi:hypothetical protein RchiOBHm_Chr4g0416991 [Rosa chinensis]|uniref:Uncharacterized protein n=1 Tax=Rosa chinensis TaxID=74649 RepID=A0A2P6QWY9_ROSCH|nr:hypothetical protein RchiOBHm_Chr4g0416991 [Rosa chinensis]